MSTTPTTELTAPVALESGVQVAAPIANAESVYRYYEQAKSPNTRRAYAACWKAFRAWCAPQGVEALDAGPELVASYLASMADAGRKFSTVSVALAGIAYTLAESGKALDTRHPGLVRVVSGIRRTIGSRPSKKAALMGQDLKGILAKCDDTLLGKRDRALLALGWSGAFRRSELVALEVSDIEFTADGIVATVRRSKTDQVGAGLQKAIPYSASAKACAVRAVKAWLEASGVTSGPLLRSVDRHGSVGSERMAGYSVALIVKRHAGEAGLEESTFAGHSLRSGFITTAVKRGKALDAIMRQSGHKSHDVAMGYVRAASLFDDSAAAVGLL